MLQAFEKKLEIRGISAALNSLNSHNLNLFLVQRKKSFQTILKIFIEIFFRLKNLTCSIFSPRLSIPTHISTHCSQTREFDWGSQQFGLEIHAKLQSQSQVRRAVNEREKCLN